MNLKTAIANFNGRKFGVPFVIILIALASIVGVFVFNKYIDSEKKITEDLANLKERSPNLTIEQCAQDNIQWYLQCHSMKQICDETVKRRMKICLVNGEKEAQCENYGSEVFGYNFGFQQCQPYLKKRDLKKACADTWQVVADFCKASSKFKNR